MIYELPWPHCGERRAQVRRAPRNQFELELAKGLRGSGRQTFYKPEIKKSTNIYQWDEPNR